MTLHLRRSLVLAAALLVLHEGGRRGLDALGVAEALFASGGGAFGPALIVALLVVRLLLYFVAPGLVLAALVLAAGDVLRRGRAGRPG